MTAAVIAAAGSSVRMGGTKKEYRFLEARDADGAALTVLGAAVAAFADSGEVGIVVVSVPPGGAEAARAALPKRFAEGTASVPVVLAEGGATRRDSVHRALAVLEARGGVDLVLIHDGARPWVDGALIGRAVRAAREKGAAIPVVPLVETPKEIAPDGAVVRHLRRASVAAAQTPQAFAFPRILRAHERAARREAAEGVEYTDDAEVWGEFEGPVASFPGSPANRKITFPEDLP